MCIRDSGSTWNTAVSSPAETANSNSVTIIQPLTTLLNITNITNQKMYVSCYIEDGGVIPGDPNQIQTNIIFKKVA